MKLTIFLSCILAVQAIAIDTYSQKTLMTINLQSATLENVLNEIENKSDFYFLYNNKLIDVSKKVNADFKNANIEQILKGLFPDSEVKYFLIDKQIILSPANMNNQVIPIKGKVTDTDGNPMPGVNIHEKGTTNGTITDLNGDYTISVGSTNAIIVFSFIGYLTEEIPVVGKSEINITLIEDVLSLGEVVVVGYGTMKKVDLTGSVSSIKGDELKTTNAVNVATAIAGKLPGLQVTQLSGEPGSSSVIRMRGVGSVYSGTDPLVLIDGFPGDLSHVSPNDVESITVLKDAASASIYGSRAANGVILITTKKGSKNQDLKVELNAKYGIQRPTNIPEILDSKTWCEKMNQSTLASSGIEYWTGDYAPENQTTNTNWLDYLFRNDAPMQEYNISALGGAEKLRYALNIGYLDQEGIMINQNYNRYNIRSNIDYISDRFAVGANMYRLHSDNEQNISPTNNVMYDAFITPPTIPVYNADGLPGTPREGAVGEDVLMDNTPSMDAISCKYDNTSDLSVVNLFAEFKLIDELKFKTIFNYKSTDAYTEVFYPEWYTYRPDDTDHETVFMGNSESELTCTAYSSTTWESQNLLTYKKEINKQVFDFLVGYSAQKTNSATLKGTATGLVRNSVQSLNAASDISSLSGYTSEGTLISQFGRINYAYDEKYLAQFNLRRDGSSVFGDDHHWGTFPSASVGWRVSKEKFMQGFTFIDDMKIRAGVGTLGNSNIPSGQWYASVNFWADYVFGADQALYNGSSTGTYNPDITWEKTTTYNIGLDMAMFENKLDLSFEIFKRRTTDMLLVMPLPASNGYSSDPYVNLGGVDNDGWEVIAQYKDQIGEVYYNIGMNLTHVENEVTDMGGLSPIIEAYTRTEKGYAINPYYGYVVEGIYQSETDVSENPSFEGAQPGDFKYKDLNEDGIINEEDQQYLGDAIPQFYFGGNINISYKSFDLGLFFQGEFDKQIMITPNYGMDFGVLYTYANMYKEVYDDRWTKEGDNKYPALGSGLRSMNNNCNTTWLQDAGYFRVKSVQLGYTLPDDLTSKVNIEKVRLYLTGTNLLTFTKYIGFDPEMGTRQKRSDGTGLYMDKVYTYGGCDYPQAKTILAGINITF